jgi:amidohydrolase
MIRQPQIADIDNIMAVHIWNGLPVGVISAEAGPRMACADNIYLKIKGKSAHGASPQQSVDAIVAACAVVTALQTVVSRKVDPLEPVVVSIGTIHGGTSSNIIANEVELSGTVRCFAPKLRETIPLILEGLALQTAKAYGAECDFEYRRCTPPTINEAKSSERACRAVVKLLGKQGLVRMEKVMGGEDFAWYLEKFPGCIAFIGSRNEAEDKCWPHHHERFDVDESAFVNGTALLVQYVLETQDNLES